MNEIKIKKLLCDNKIDAALVSSPENFYYITGYASHQHSVSRSPMLASLIISAYDSFKTKAVVMDYEFETFRMNSNVEVLMYDTWVGVRTPEQIEKQLPATQRTLKNIIDIIEQVFREEKLSEKVIGLELGFIPYNFYNILCSKFPEAKFIDISPLFIKARSVKTDEEVDIFRKLITIQDNALNTVKDHIKPGISELELSYIYRNEVVKSNYCLPSTWSMFSFGENCSRLGLPTNRVCKDGDTFKYDGGVNAEFKFYTTDFSRSYIIGKQDSMLKGIKRRLYDAQRMMIDNIKPGVVISEIFNMGFNYVKDSYISYERGHLGHSISLGPQTSEIPFINKTDNTVLEKNMILCVEVPLYIRSIGGFNIEDMVLVTENGCEVLSNITPHFLECEL